MDVLLPMRSPYDNIILPPILDPKSLKPLNVEWPINLMNMLGFLFVIMAVRVPQNQHALIVFWTIFFARGAINLVDYLIRVSYLLS